MAKKATQKRAGDTSDDMDALGTVHNVGNDIEMRELWLTPIRFDPEGHTPDVEPSMANQFIRNLRFLNQASHEPILVLMFTGGGDWISCLAIYDAIRYSESPVTVVCFGEASSASGIILQAADLRVMMPNSHLMLHSGSIQFGGTGEDLETTANWSRKEYELMLKFFARRSPNMTVGKIDAGIKKNRDWYMAAPEAVEMGFADAIIGSEGFENISTVKARKVLKQKQVP